MGEASKKARACNGKPCATPNSESVIKAAQTAGTTGASFVADELLRMPGGVSVGQTLSLGVNIAEQASTGNYNAASTFGAVAGGVAGTVAGGALFVLGAPIVAILAVPVVVGVGIGYAAQKAYPNLIPQRRSIDSYRD